MGVPIVSYLRCLTLSLQSCAEIVFLSSNNFTGPIFFTSRSREESHLKGLYLSDNKFFGPIPMALCHFKSLEAVFLDQNEFTGGIPPCISKLSELVQLYLFNNQLDGEVPNELSVLLKLGKNWLVCCRRCETGFWIGCRTCRPTRWLPEAAFARRDR